jgi:Rrf2 family protein
MKLQTNTRLALYSVLEFAAADGRQVAAAEIARKHGVSVHHLAKVLAELARAGIVASARGAGGGYRFAANPRRLTLHDVIRRFEDLTANDAPDRSDRTPAGRALAAVLSEIDEIALATFRSITVATMLRILARQVVKSDGPAASLSRRRKRRVACRPRRGSQARAVDPRCAGALAGAATRAAASLSRRRK